MRKFGCSIWVGFKCHHKQFYVEGAWDKPDRKAEGNVTTEADMRCCNPKSRSDYDLQQSEEVRNVQQHFLRGLMQLKKKLIGFCTKKAGTQLAFASAKIWLVYLMTFSSTIYFETTLIYGNRFTMSTQPNNHGHVFFTLMIAL